MTETIKPRDAAGASGTEESRFAFWGRAFGRWASTRGDVLNRFTVRNTILEKVP